MNNITLIIRGTSWWLRQQWFCRAYLSLSL